jgi:hypothetical protein
MALSGDTLIRLALSAAEITKLVVPRIPVGYLGAAERN